MRVRATLGVVALLAAAGCTSATPGNPASSTTPTIADRVTPAGDMAALDSGVLATFLATGELALVEAVATGVVFDRWEDQRTVIDVDELRSELRERMGPTAGYDDVRFVLDQVNVEQVSVSPDPDAAPDGINIDMVLEHATGMTLTMSAGNATYIPKTDTGEAPAHALAAWAAFRSFSGSGADLGSPATLDTVNHDLEHDNIAAAVSDVSGSDLTDVRFTLTSTLPGRKRFVFDATQLPDEFVRHASKLWLPTFD